MLGVEERGHKRHQTTILHECKTYVKIMCQKNTARGRHTADDAIPTNEHCLYIHFRQGTANNHQIHINEWKTLDLL